MNEIELIVDGIVYRLTNRNNNNKYDRAIRDAGFNATLSQQLAHYDKHGGYIQDKDGNKVENEQFWKVEKARLAKKQKWKEKWDKIKNFGNAVESFIKWFFVVSIFMLFVFGLGAWFFGYDKIILIIKKIKELM